MKSDNNDHDMMKTVSRVSTMFSVLFKDMDLKKQNEQRMRFYIAGSNGLIAKPKNWDSLPEEEKKRRLDKIDSIGLE